MALTLNKAASQTLFVGLAGIDVLKRKHCDIVTTLHCRLTQVTQQRMNAPNKDEQLEKLKVDKNAIISLNVEQNKYILQPSFIRQTFSMGGNAFLIATA